MRKTMKKGLVYFSAAALLAGCSQNTGTAAETAAAETTEAATNTAIEGAVNIALSDDEITVDGEKVSEDPGSAVYTSCDIVYYEAGKDFTYGEGTEKDEHTAEEAEAHTVVHITEPGTYALSGKLSAGQIAVDLGEDAEEDPEAVVTLVLNGVDIDCSVAPGVIFYNVYECGSTDVDSAVKDVDTTAAGANVVIADGTENTVNGSYVARIYKSVELNAEGTEVVDSKKLHKYDAAFYSKMSMNVDGGEEGTGILNINAENEGLDSELHLTINGGNINIESGNDGINTNEDGVSVTTVNGGTLTIKVNGSTGEGDGIDSNGWLVINGGTVIAEACSFSGDAGIDSDMGIHINGGTVMATGNMLDRISDSEQNFAVFTFAENQKGGETYTLKDADGNEVLSCSPENGFSYLILSDEKLTEGTYTLWMGETQLAGAKGESGKGGFGGGMQGGGQGGMQPGGMMQPRDGEAPELPEGMTLPETAEATEMSEPAKQDEAAVETTEVATRADEAEKPEGGKGQKMPGGMTPPEKPEGGKMPEDGEMPEMPEGMTMPENGEMPQGGGRPGGMGGMQGGKGQRGEMENMEVSAEFEIAAGGNYFSSVKVQ